MWLGCNLDADWFLLSFMCDVRLSETRPNSNTLIDTIKHIMDYETSHLNVPQKHSIKWGYQVQSVNSSLGNLRVSVQVAYWINTEKLVWPRSCDVYFMEPPSREEAEPSGRNTGSAIEFLELTSITPVPTMLLFHSITHLYLTFFSHWACGCR